MSNHLDHFSPRLPSCQRGLLVSSSPQAAWLADGPTDEQWAGVETARLPKMQAGLMPAVLASARMATVPRLDMTNALITVPALSALLAFLPLHVRSLALQLGVDTASLVAHHLRSGLEELYLYATST